MTDTMQHYPRAGGLLKTAAERLRATGDPEHAGLADRIDAVLWDLNHPASAHVPPFGGGLLLGDQPRTMRW